MLILSGVRCLSIQERYQTWFLDRFVEVVMLKTLSGGPNTYFISAVHNNINIFDNVFEVRKCTHVIKCKDRIFESVEVMEYV